jgi:pimeloyl-ACP methyl ester carboxylesterase
MRLKTISRRLALLAAMAGFLGSAGCVASERQPATVESMPVAESGFVRIGGIDQWISMHGDDRNNPVLLIVHGGPGFTNAPYAPAMEPWRRAFTVVDWDQRGAGRTFGRNRTGGHGEMTFDRLALDGIEVAEHLRARLGKKRIAVLAMSAGSVTGLKMVQARPDLFSAYVGTGQFIDAHEGDAVGYRLTLERARATGNAEAITALEAIGPPPWSDPKNRSAAKGWAGRTTPASDPASRMNVPTMLRALADYTESDIRNATDGYAFSDPALFPQLSSFNVRSLGLRYRVPIFIFQGAGDLNTPTELVVRWFNEIEAPAKEIRVIENASHGAFYANADDLGRLLSEAVRPVAQGVD